MQAEKLDMKEIEYLVILKPIDEVERLNPSISVNVYGYETSAYPLRVSTHRVDTPVIYDLLPICDGEKRHDCLINTRVDSYLHNRVVKMVKYITAVID